MAATKPCPRCGKPLPEEGACPCVAASASATLLSSAPTSGGAPVPLGESTLADFRPGALLAGRYRLIRSLGHGGMGQVLEVEDSELGERVALKLLKPELGADSTALARFRREIRLARKVSHPNVCRVFDVGKLELAGPGDERREIPFLTMALLEGETLAERIRSRGRMATAEALPLVRQMAAALAAAHEVGVIHRDFKPSNVILVQGSLGEQAVVTDFGLAVGAGAETALTGTGVIGTPAYMAPEQVQGSRVTAASDVYALGLVMFELLTGQRAFGGGTAVEVALRRLTAPTPRTSSLVPDLDPTWDEVVSRCLEREPTARFADAAAVVKALTGESLETSPFVRRRRRWRISAVIAAAALVLGAAAAGFLTARAAAKREQGTVSGRRAVAVLGFANLSGSPGAAWLETALAESLGLELAVGEQLQRVSGEDVARLKQDLGLSDGGSLRRETLAKVRARTGADITVSGSYLALPGAAGRTLRLNLTVQSTDSGATVCELVEEGSETDLLQLLARTGARLRERLGGGEVAKAQPTTGLSASLEANQLYAQGLDRLREFDAGAALPLLERAVTVAPSFALARSALARALAAVGHAQQASDQARQALAAAAGLPREERLVIEGQCHELSGDLPRAVEVYRSLCELFPDDLDHGLRLAEAQVTGGDPRAALATVAELRSRLAPPRRDDPRLDLIEARAHYFLSDNRRQLEAARTAEARARALGTRLILARALDIQGSAYRSLAEFERASAALEEAGRLYAEVGNRRQLARVRNIVGNLRYQQGDLEAAVAAYREAMATVRELGSVGDLGPLLHNLAFALYQRGDGGEAIELVTESIGVCEQSGQRAEIGEALRKLGLIQLDLGRVTAASASVEQALVISREVGRRWGEEIQLELLAWIALEQGRLELAEERLAEADRISQEQAAAAGLADEGTPISIRGIQARLALARGDSAAAETVSRALIEDLVPQATLDARAAIVSSRALALLASGRAAEALTAVEQAVARLEESSFARPRLQLEVVRGRVEAALGRHPQAVAHLEAAAAEATRRGIVPFRLEAELALAELELARDGESARERLAAIETEARALGFVRLADAAAAAAAS